MQIMTKINDFEEILFKSSIIFHVFAHAQKKGFSFGKILFYFQTDGRQTDGTKRVSLKSLSHPVATSMAFIFSTLYICLSDEHHPFTFIALRKKEQPQVAPFQEVP